MMAPVRGQEYSSQPLLSLAWAAPPGRSSGSEGAPRNLERRGYTRDYWRTSGIRVVAKIQNEIVCVIGPRIWIAPCWSSKQGRDRRQRAVVPADENGFPAISRIR